MLFSPLALCLPDLGCLLLEGKIPLDISRFSESIMKEKLHPNIYLRFGLNHSRSWIEQAGRNDPECSVMDSEHVRVLFTQHIDRLTVMVLFAKAGHEPPNIKKFWNPKLASNRFDLEKSEPALIVPRAESH